MLSEFAELADHIKSHDTRLVVFDGRCGAGKTTTMYAMRSALRLPGLDGDAFLVRGHGPYRRPYVESLELQELRNSTEQALRLSSTVLLSMVCARQVAELASLPKATFIYVEHATPTLLEVQRRDFDDDFMAPDPDRQKHPLHWEVEEYHRSAYGPRKHADAVFFSVRE